jgi:hypothetical protein
MKKLKARTTTVLLVTINVLMLSGFLSLSPAKPNEPVDERPPNDFNQPEIQDGISNSESKALQQLCDLYAKYPERFDAAFTKMYQVGIPEVRRYCSPLQALFWLAEDNNLSNKYVTKYRLSRLLSHAWHKKIQLTDDQVLQIIEGILDKDRQDRFLHDIQNGVDEATKKKLIAYYRRSPNMFLWWTREIIRMSDRRWADSDTIIDRLNAPELLDFYINRNIRYKHIRPYYHRSPHSVIHQKYGDCDDLAYFGKTVLTKAGYDVFGRIVGDENIYCHIGLGIRLEDGSYFLAVHFNQRGNHMSGPYKTILELDRALGYGRGFYKRGAFTFDWF